MVFLKLLWVGATLLVSGKFVEFFDDTKERPDGDPRPDPAATSAMEGTADAAPPVSAAPPVPAVPPPASLLSDEQQLRGADRTLALTGSALALIAAGAFIHPALRLLSLPFLGVALVPSLVDEAKALAAGGGVKYQTLEAIRAIVEISMGYIGLTAGGWFVFVAGQRLLISTRRDVNRQLVSVLGDVPEHVWLVADGAEVQVPLARVVAGDLIAVRAGDLIPVDGHIVEGELSVDQRALTGESRLQDLLVGDPVRAATLVLGGSAIVRTERTGRDTVAARVDVLLATSTSYEQQLQARVTQITDRSVPPTLLVAGYGYLTQGPTGALGGFWTSSLDIAWLSSPLSMRATCQAAAEVGMLIKDGRSLELLTKIDTVVFDKTGTLTLDRFEIHAVHRFDAAHSEAELLRMAAALEGRQPHPIARAIVDAARRDPEPLPDVEDPHHEIGYGVRGVIGGRAVALGSRRMMASAGVATPPEIEGLAAAAEDAGRTLSYLAIDGRLAALLEIAAQVRPGALAVVQDLRRRGLEVLMITGDDEGPAQTLAAALGIDRWFSRALPEDKAQIVERLQAEGRRVCFVGDGINDAIAMHRATVSVSIQGASAVAVDSAQVLIRPDVLGQLPILFEIGARYAADQRIIESSAKLSTAFNVAGFLFAGFSLGTVVGIYLASFGVSLAVALLPRVRRYREDDPAAPAPARLPEPVRPPVRA